MHIRGVIPVYWQPKGQKLSLLGVASWVYYPSEPITGSMYSSPLISIAGLLFKFSWIESLAFRLRNERVEYWSLAEGVSAKRIKGNVVYLSTADLNKVLEYLLWKPKTAAC
jgi:hypothetical protein